MSDLNFPWLAKALSRLPAGLPAALLVSGPRGLGKERLALALSQSILCEGPSQPARPCGTCPACHLFAAGNHPDFRHLRPEADEKAEEGASSRKAPSLVIKVGAVRELDSLLSISAHRGKGRVVLISPAESLHPSAANALLKMLEEPPANAHFILVSHEPERLLPTIRSRCFKLPVGAPDASAARHWVQAQAGERAELALAMGGYAPLRALEMAADEAFWRQRRTLMEAFWRGPAAAVDLAEQAEPIQPELLADLLSMCCHDLLSARHGAQIRYHRDFERDIRNRSAKVDPRHVAQWHKAVLEFARAANHPLNRRLALEALFELAPRG
jgi:DNA polymerase III subunit delta'